MNAENLRQTHAAKLAAVGAGNSAPAFFCHTDIEVKKVSILSPNAIAADDNGLVLQLVNGSKVVAELRVSTGGQGAVGQNAGKFFAVAPQADGSEVCPAGSVLQWKQVQGGQSLDGILAGIEYVRLTNK